MPTSNLTTIASLPVRLTIGGVISQLESTLSELINDSFDRLDQTTLLAAQQAQATINSARIQTEDVLDKAFSELDNFQTAIFNDLNRLLDSLEEIIDGLTTVIDAKVNQILTDLRLLLSDEAGAIYLSSGVATSTSEEVRLEITGTALSQLELEHVKIEGISADYLVEEQDDNKMIISFSLDPVELAANDTLLNGDVLDLKVSFEVSESFFFGIFKHDKRMFATKIYILPEVIGKAIAVFIGDIDVLQVEPLTFSGYEHSIKTKWNTKSKDKTFNIGITPREGWRFDVDSLVIDSQRIGSCSGSRAKSFPTHLSEHSINVAVKPRPDRKARVRCRMKTTLKVNQWKLEDQQKSLTSEHKELKAEGKVVVALNEIVGHEQLVNPRLSHFEILAVDGDGTETERSIIKPDETYGGFEASFDDEANIATLTASYITAV